MLEPRQQHVNTCRRRNGIWSFQELGKAGGGEGRDAEENGGKGVGEQEMKGGLGTWDLSSSLPKMRIESIIISPRKGRTSQIPALWINV
jgi:hypothetical protein